MAVIQKIIQGSQPPVSAGVGLVQFIQDYSKINSQEVLQIQSVVKTSSIQYSLDNPIHPYRPYSINLYGLGPIGPLLIPLWEFHHTVQFSRWPELYFPIRTIQSLIHLPGSTFQLFTYTGHLFSTWGLFPQLINIVDLFLSLFSFTLLKLILIILSQSFKIGRAHV